MAGQRSSVNLRGISGIERPVVGSPEWNKAFPAGVQPGQSTPLPEGTDLGQGFIPEVDTTRNPNTGNPWQGG
jgi:hypothetical protein